MNLQVSASNVDAWMKKLVSETAKKWEGYKEDFFIHNDAEGVLKASFVIGYALFRIEFMNETIERMRMYNNVAQVQANLPRLERERYGPDNLPGFNYLTMNTNRRPFMSASIILKRQLLSKTYNQLEKGMVETVKEKASTIPRTSNLKEIFKYSGYAPTSKFTQSFFYHSLVMFGWYMFYGWRTTTDGRRIATEFPGSCNVQGVINMYLFKRLGLLNKIVYTPHGMIGVSRTGNINKMTAQRARGTDDIQFCHHAWKLVGEVTNTSSGYFPAHQVKVMRSHVDAFDVLTLTPIFRAIQRLKRTGKEDRVKYVDMLLDLINSDIKAFVTGHLMSNLPGNARYTSSTTNVVNNRTNASITHYKYKVFLKNYNSYLENGKPTEKMNSMKQKYGTNYNKFMKIRNAINKATINKNNIFSNVTRNNLIRKGLTQNEADIAMKHLN